MSHNCRASHARISDDEVSRLAAVGMMAPNVIEDVNHTLQTVSRVLKAIDRRIAEGDLGDLSDLTADGVNAIQRASAISRRLLTYGRAGAPLCYGAAINDRLCDLEPLLRAILGPSIVLTVTLADRPIEAGCDPQGLETAILNLAVNAREAMPQGGVFMLQALHAELVVDRPRLRRGTYLMLTAQHAAIGISSRSFDQGSDPIFTTRPTGAGSHLGLAAIRAIAESAGGGADLATSPSGAIVRLYLPQARAA